MCVKVDLWAFLPFKVKKWSFLVKTFVTCVCLATTKLLRYVRTGVRRNNQ